MKSILLLVTMAFAYAMADTSVQYAGTTVGGFAWNPPILNGGTTQCTASTGNNYPTVTFNVTFTSAGVREIAAMAERDFKDSLEIYIYLGGFPTAPCMNIAITDDLTKQFGFGGGPVIDDFVYFTAATYTFVITGANSGIFAVHINPSDQVGQLTTGSPTWTQPDSRGSSSSTGAVTMCEESTDSTDAPFGTYTFSQATSGFYDLVVMFVNSTAGVGYGSYITVYSGVPTTQELSISPCNTSATWIASQVSGADGTFVPYVNITAGVNYTLVVSLSAGYYGYWAVQVIPTRIRFFSPPGYVQPNREFDTTSTTVGCTASDLTAPWGATFFTAQESVYVIDTASPPSPFTYADTYSFLYYGLNTAVPPTTCTPHLILGGDTGDVTPVYAYTQTGANYTVIVSTYSLTSVPSTAAYVLYFFTGNALGSIPSITTTGAATTGAGTTGVATGTTGTATGTATGTTVTVTGSGPVTVATGTTTHSTAAATGTTTSGAVSVALSMVAASAVAFSVLL